MNRGKGSGGGQLPACLVRKAGHSGYSNNSGRVIWVVGNSGIKNYYPIFAPKKHYLFGFGFYPIYQKLTKPTILEEFKYHFKAINNSPINHIMSLYQLSSEHKSTLIHTK
jgi:hypothetical protein